MDFTYTREDNDQTLLSRIDAIRQGQDLEVLEPFAKVYLGLFYDVDNQIAPAERIDLLANAELATAIKLGLQNVLLRPDLPSVESITEANLNQKNLTIGYVILAGISLYAEQDIEKVYELPEQTRSAAICFHHFISTFHDDNWYQPLLNTQTEQSARALLSMWQVLINKKQDFLPGLKPVIEEPNNVPLFTKIVVPLLLGWTHCRHRDLSSLLSQAIRHADHAELLAAAEEMQKKAELMNLRNQVYWQTTAFLLDPEQQGQNLINFMGQEKIKLLPMLDFIIPLLDNDEDPSFALSATGYGFLIRCLAQKFTPQMDMYDNLGEISLRVLWLFYMLACFSKQEGGETLNSLRKVRVLKLYKEIFNAIADYQLSPDKPDFHNFIQTLRDEGRLRMKKNWHDVR
ncbi:MAG: hypothetical protein OEY52_07720 [Gammaproteobacteria bacterium]|nr:hypothetical protein [Gammaproteobacteria bacterium]